MRELVPVGAGTVVREYLQHGDRVRVLRSCCVVFASCPC